MAYGLTPDYGPMIDGEQVESAALETLKLWLPSYVAAKERAMGLAPRTLPLVADAGWAVSTDIDRWPGPVLPSVLLASTGLADKPSRDGKGMYRARFTLGVAVVVSARDARAANRLAKAYTAVLRTCLLQQSTLGGLASGVEWEDEQYDALPSRKSDSLASGQVVLTVEVEDMGTARSGPRGTPPDDPYSGPPAPAPEVQSATATVTPRAIGQ